MRLLSAVLLTALLAVGCGDENPVAPSAGAAGGGTTNAESNFPPGQNPSGNPAQAPGCSNPNTQPGDCKK
jgi:hypothetical protein